MIDPFYEIRDSDLRWHAFRLIRQSTLPINQDMILKSAQIALIFHKLVAAIILAASSSSLNSALRTAILNFVKARQHFILRALEVAKAFCLGGQNSLKARSMDQDELCALTYAPDPAKDGLQVKQWYLQKYFDGGHVFFPRKHIIRFSIYAQST